jgi:hypothetical protein
MKKKLFISALLSISILLSFAQRQQKKTAAFYEYKSECMGVELDGSQTLKAWGNGRNRADACEQAKKNAVRDVLFIGISEGKSDCNIKPVLFEVNVQEKNEDYFNKFFADGGEYKNYVNLKDERIFDKISRDRKKTKESVTHGMVVRVLRAQLKEKMIADQIIKTN